MVTRKVTAVHVLMRRDRASTNNLVPTRDRVSTTDHASDRGRVKDLVPDRDRELTRDRVSDKSLRTIKESTEYIRVYGL